MLIVPQSKRLQQICLCPSQIKMARILRKGHIKLIGELIWGLPLWKIVKYSDLQDGPFQWYFHRLYDLHAFFWQYGQKIGYAPDKWYNNCRIYNHLLQSKYVVGVCGSSLSWSRLRVKYEDKSVHFELDGRLSFETDLFTYSSMFFWSGWYLRGLGLLLSQRLETSYYIPMCNSISNLLYHYLGLSWINSQSTHEKRQQSCSQKSIKNSLH